jgi:hypothetical protein
VTRLPPLVRNGRRSRACSRSCAEGQPCTLRVIRHAERLLGEYPELTLWAEVGCAAHEIGYFAPGLAVTPSLTRLREQFSTEPRLVECAIAHATEQAIGTRYEMLQKFYDPEGLGRHLGAAAAAAIKGQGLGEICRRDRGRWRAGRQRFADVEHWLTLLADGTQTPARSHAEAVTAAAERGLELREGASPADHLAHLRSLPWVHHVGERQNAILVGTADPPTFWVAAGALAGPAGSSDEQVATAFNVLTWGNPAQGDRLRLMMCPPPKQNPTPCGGGDQQ